MLEPHEDICRLYSHVSGKKRTWLIQLPCDSRPPAASSIAVQNISSMKYIIYGSLGFTYRVSHNWVLTLFLLFCWLIFILIAKVGVVLKNSGNLLHDRHKKFENQFRNCWDNWGQSFQLKNRIFFSASELAKCKFQNDGCQLWPQLSQLFLNEF